MASWTLVPCLVSLRNEFNRLAPERDKASDGSIGDAAHQQEPSDHNPDETGRTPYEDADHINEVHAIDVDDDLHKTGWSMQKCVEIIVTRHREVRDDRLQNVIYNRRIWSRSWGWTARAYTGASAHTEHAHFSARYTTAQERDTRPWGLLEADDVTKSEFTSWMTEWAKSSAGKQALAIALLTYDPGKNPNGTIKPGGVINVGNDAPTNPTVQPSWALSQAMVAAIVAAEVDRKVDAMQATLNRILAGIGGSVPAQVNPATALDALASDGPSPEEAAAALRDALGDRAAEVGRLLAG
jgi:hypothetical protein